MSTRPSIIIVGGGTAGIHAARALRWLDEIVDVTLIEPTGTHQFLTRLAAVAGGVLPIEDASEPLDALVDCEIVTDTVERVAEGSVVLGSGQQRAADVIILTAGAQPSQPPIPGLRHAVSLRTAADALEIQYRVSKTDAVVVIGGGPTGCQLAGALASGPYHVFVTLIERNSGLLTGFNPALGARALEILTDRGVSVLTGRDVTEIGPESVETSTGTASGMPVWTGGFEARIDRLIDAPTRDGRLVVDDVGRVAGFERVFAAGDIAAHRNGDGIHPMSAQIAVKAGRTVAFNALQLLRDQPLTKLDLTDLGWVVDMSGGQGVADLFGMPLTVPGLDRLVPLLHDVIDIRNLAQLGALHTLWRESSPSDAQRTNDLTHR
ncbi:MAG: FAD-dependent oxidoreductase [Acidimicrobiia bacterium]|nr:FAD-dependent oxidoreductase [Acidimicrobiia bacterium]